MWKAIGPAPLDTSKGAYETPNMSPSAGHASAVAVDPKNPATMTWAPLMDLEPTLAVGAIALDPAAPQTLYVGTGEPAPYIGYAGQGILRSTDGGATFEKIGGGVFDGLVVSRIVVDAGAGAIHAAATFGSLGRGQSCNNDYDAPGQGLYRSADGGATWILLRAGKMIDIEVDTSVTPRRLMISDGCSSQFAWLSDPEKPRFMQGPTGPGACREGFIPRTAPRSHLSSVVACQDPDSTRRRGGAEAQKDIENLRLFLRLRVPAPLR